MDQLGIVSEVEVTSIRVAGNKDKNNKEKDKNRIRGKIFEDELRIGDPKKKIKNSVGSD
jgi:hypothetical protein